MHSYPTQPMSQQWQPTNPTTHHIDRSHPYMSLSHGFLYTLTPHWYSPPIQTTKTCLPRRGNSSGWWTSRNKSKEKTTKSIGMFTNKTSRRNVFSNKQESKNHPIISSQSKNWKLSSRTAWPGATRTGPHSTTCATTCASTSFAKLKQNTPGTNFLPRNKKKVAPLLKTDALVCLSTCHKNTLTGCGISAQSRQIFKVHWLHINA